MPAPARSATRGSQARQNRRELHRQRAIPAKDSALASAGAELRLANGISLIGKFDGEFAAHSSTYGGTGAIRYTW
jgi:uncharacterized protein with beta-barrel porin domain